MGKKLYKPTSYSFLNGLTVLAIILVLTIATAPDLMAGWTMVSGKWIGLGIFWAMGMALTFLPLGFSG